MRRLLWRLMPRPIRRLVREWFGWETRSRAPFDGILVRDNYTGDIVALPIVNGQIDLSSLGTSPRVSCLEREDTLYDDSVMPFRRQQYRIDKN